MHRCPKNFHRSSSRFSSPGDLQHWAVAFNPQCSWVIEWKGPLRSPSALHHAHSPCQSHMSQCPHSFPLVQTPDPCCLLSQMYLLRVFQHKLRTDSTRSIVPNRRFGAIWVACVHKVEMLSQPWATVRTKWGFALTSLHPPDALLLLQQR